MPHTIRRRKNLRISRDYSSEWSSRASNREYKNIRNLPGVGYDHMYNSVLLPKFGRARSREIHYVPTAVTNRSTSIAENEKEAFKCNAAEELKHGYSKYIGLYC